MQETPKSDDTVETFVRFASGLEYEDIPAEAIWEAKRRIIDSIAIALAGFQEEPSVIARRFALASTGSPGATVIGTKHAAFPELAVLANGTMLHSQDFMDTYLSRESLHPSDTIAAVLAAAEVAERNGKDVILGIVLAYEVMCRLADVANVRERGWDHVVFGVIASALAAARVLGSSADQMREALALAVVSNTALRQTRVGEIPMWKAFAPANAARNGLVAAQLATMGVTGPVLPFRGERGFERQVSGPLELESFGNSATGFMINKTFIKNWPVQYNTQAGIQAALALRGEVGASGRIERIIIEVSETGRVLAADTAAKWDPQTRETADHSLPYIVVAALLDGEVTRATFDRDAYRDPEKLALLGRVEVRTDDEFTRTYPKMLSIRVTVWTGDGRELSHQVDIPKGHPLDPLTDSELERKFRDAAGVYFGSHDMRRALDSIWSLETAPGVGDLVAQFEIEGGLIDR